MPTERVTTSSGHAAVTPETVKRTPEGVDQLPSGRWRARITDPDGRRVTVGTYANPTDAGRAVRRARTDVERGDWIDPHREGVTVGDWFALWMPHREVRASTLVKDWERYRLHIKPYLAEIPLAALTPFKVQRWLKQLERDGRSDALRGKAFTLLKTALGPKGAIGDRRRKDNPCEGLKPPVHHPDVWTLLTPSQYDKIHDQLGMYQAFGLCGWEAGMRYSEIAGLQRHDWNPLRREITITRAVTYLRGTFYIDRPKNSRQRTVPAPARLTDALNAAVEGLDRHDWVFTAPRGGTLRQPHFSSRVWTPATQRANVPARFHDLRHSYASRLLAGGASLAEVRDLCGHSSVTVTELYLHTTRDSLADAVKRALG